jgi:Rnl2 family RNA ligase
MPIEFKSYSDIENSYRLKTISMISDHGLAYGDWVVTEKVHGSNFSFGIAYDEIKCGKRSGWLEKDNFFNYQDVLEDLNKNLCVLFHLVCEAYNLPKEQVKCILYGEIFGGSYPHKDVPKHPTSIRVQKGVFYSPYNEFYAFDLKVNGSYINYNLFQELMEATGFFYAKPLYIGDLKTCLAYPNEFPTTIPNQLGYPLIDHNICEGVVIKPLDTRYFTDGSRVILKNKNERFKEVSEGNVKIKDLGDHVSIIELTEESKTIIENVSAYITKNRLIAVLSKIGDVTDKDFGKLLGLFVQDVIKDFEKDNDDIISKTESDQRKLIKNGIRGLGIDFVRKDFVNIIDKTY